MLVDLFGGSCCNQLSPYDCHGLEITERPSLLSGTMNAFTLAPLPATVTIMQTLPSYCGRAVDVFLTSQRDGIAGLANRGKRLAKVCAKRTSLARATNSAHPALAPGQFSLHRGRQPSDANHSIGVGAPH